MKSTTEYNLGIAFKFTDLVDYAQGSVVSKTIHKRNAGNVSVFAFDKGEGLSEHTAKFDAMVQIIDGTAEILIDRKPMILSVGESIVMPANIPHALNATEKFKMILTMIKE